MGPWPCDPWPLTLTQRERYPPNPSRFGSDIEKFAHFVSDSGAKFALTTTLYKKIVTASKVRPNPKSGNAIREGLIRIKVDPPKRIVPLKARQ